MNNLDFDVVIVGGGLVGASCALALSSRWRVAVLERNAFPTTSADLQVWDNRVYAVSPGNREFLRSLGAWRVPSERVGNIREMDVRGDRGGAIHFDALEMATDSLASIVENSALQAALWQQLKGRATLIDGATLEQVIFKVDQVVLQLNDGRQVSAALAIGADGANSWLRQAAGIGFSRSPYGQNGVVANFECERPHREIARQWFREDGILAWLPLPGNRISIVWSTGDEHTKQLLALDEDAFAARVTAAGGRALGTLKPLTRAVAFPLSLGRAEKVYTKRLALLGDAAHTVHPLAGQGVNLGFGDVQCLANIITGSEVTDPGAEHLLARYARGRAEPVWAMQTVCDGLQKLFGAKDPVWAFLRNTGLSATDRVTPIKRLLMRQAFQ